jgi:hypothetical protein
MISGAAKAAPIQQSDPILLVYGQTVDAQITSQSPSVFYAFDAQSGEVVTITMVVTSGDLDPFLVLNNAERLPLATDDNSGGGLNARLTFVIPQPGRYIIQATNAGGELAEAASGFSLNLTAAVDGESIDTPQVQPTPTESLVVTEEAPAVTLPSVQGDGTRLVKLESGATIRDTLSQQVALRFYWFEGDADDQITVEPEQLADFQPLKVLYDAAFAEQTRADPGVSLTATLPADGIYFLAVALPDAQNAGGGYGFTFNAGGMPAEEEANFIEISYGQSQQGSLDSTIPAVTYRFRGAAGDQVTITMTRAGGDLNSYLYLLDSSRQLLYEDNDSGGSNGDARLVFTLPGDGEYLIVATRLGQTQGTTSGSYLLELLSDSPVPTAAPEVIATEPVLPADYQNLPQIAYGDTVEGEITDDAYMDVYVFFGTEGDEIQVDLVSQNKEDANALDPFMLLLDDGRIPLIEHDDIVDGQERDSRIQFILPRTAYYAIVATRFDQAQGTSVGPYSLTLSKGEVSTPEDAAADVPTVIDQLAPASLEPDTPIQGTFDADATLYTFEANAGSLIDLAATTDPGVESMLILADKNLKEIVSSGAGTLTGVTLPETGTYLVILARRLGPVNAAEGSYILALTQTSDNAEEPTVADEGTGVLIYGDQVSGVIDDENVSRVYTFTGAAGEQVRIVMQAAEDSSLDCYLELQDSAGNVVEANDDIDPGVVRDSRIVTELPADGEYTILASRYVGPDADVTSGAYRLRLERVTDEQVGASAVTTPITYGQSLVGEINDEQFLLFYVFEGSAGDVVSVSVENLSGNLDSVLHLYQASGTGWTEISMNDDSPTGATYEALLSNITLPQTGKYLIAVNRYGLANESTTGTFSITLTRES